MDFLDLTIHDLQQQLKNKSVSSVEVTNALLERISASDPQINAFITVTPEQACNTTVPFLKKSP